MRSVLAVAAFDFKAIFSNVLSEWYYYLAFILVAAAAILFAKLVKPKRKRTLVGSRRIAVTGVLTALCVITNATSFGPAEMWQASLMPATCFIAGYILGPVGGFAVGWTGDFIAGIIAPHGAYNPIIALSSALWGFIPGVIFDYFNGNSVVKTVISFIIAYPLCSLLLNTVATYLMYLTGSSKYASALAYVVPRLLPTLVCTFGVNLLASVLLIKPLEKISSNYFVKNENDAK